MISKRVKKIKPATTSGMDSKAKELKAKGVDIINFGVGEPDFDTPEHIKEAAVSALKEGFTKYTPVGGILELKDAIIRKFEVDNNIKYSRDEVIVSCGAKHCLYNVAQVLYNPGDEVLIPSPYWVSYPDQVLLNDAVPVYIETSERDNFILDPDILKSKITERTKAIILNSPSNPTGSTYDRRTLEAIAEIALKFNLYIISDEIYEKLVYDGVEHISIASLDDEVKKRTIVINGLSKSHSMTGWRIGFAAGPKEIIQGMTNVQSQSTSNPTSIAQKAALVALTGPQDFVEVMKREFNKRRLYLVDRLNSIKGVTCTRPNGAFYAFPNVSSLYGLKTQNGQIIKSSLDMALYLLEKANVALVHGEPFGSDSHIRLSYALSMENIEKGLDRIEEALSRLS
ncbi:MAG: pyridoxal phosphate-dependent aminotransferase [Thermodesulfovibrionales bacterium]|nr:pyridoxal phosphate-dependent aminotransferase [Thermodesulfovibrionales bacterium]